MNNFNEPPIPDKTDVIIVGTGAAGLFTALQLPASLQVVLISKDSIENSDSYLAQGGISVLKNPTDYDSYFEDTLRAGRYENNKEAVEIMIKASQDIIAELTKYGVDFDRTENGYSYTREGAHSTYRILHHKDITGKEITGKLLENVKKQKNISIFSHTTMLNIIDQDNICSGIILETSNKKIKLLHAKVVVWATGGIGGLFEQSTNFKHITGDSFAIALEKGIMLENINYIQIHPTALYTGKPGRSFLISESVRGEGAILLNRKKERFVNELLPRDLVTTAIREQMGKDHSDYVYLSMTHMEPNEIQRRFPNIYEKCLREGYDLTKDMIKVTPAQHYIMGGVKVNANGQTSMGNLFAVGETSCNGVHGANRLASNSLLESLVFAKRAALLIKETVNHIPFTICNLPSENYTTGDQWQAQNKLLIMNEIKRRDEEFYAKWCNNANQCG
ncbi:MAG: L-aspartate oxidase [Anaerocolumna sp.]